nr:EOG090X08WK [Polyphemus pediculus]
MILSYITSKLVSDEMDILGIILNIIVDPEHKLADPACMALSNLTRVSKGSETVYQKVFPMFETLIDLSIAKDASLALINLSADEDITSKLVSDEMDILGIILNIIVDPEHKLADPACMALSNLTRVSKGSETVYQKVFPMFETLIDVFCNEKFNKHGAKLHYLGAVFSNLSQVPAMREYLVNPDKSFLQKLVSFTDYQSSVIRRGGVIGMIKNCCFQTEYHERLLSEAVDLLPKLLLPLAGPEEFDEEDNDKLPIDLQYLGSDKTREEDPDIRKMLIEALTQLCSTKFGREYLRSKNTYVILRELHKWEKDDNVMAALEHLVNIIIRYEHEIGHDNLREVEVPEDVASKFDAETV